MVRKRYETNGLGEEVDSPLSVAPLAQDRTVIERTADSLGPGPTRGGTPTKTLRYWHPLRGAAVLVQERNKG